MKATYIRISSLTQNTARQEVNLVGEAFVDKCSGVIPFEERPQGSKLIKMIKSERITELHTKSIDRLGRNAFDIACTLELLKSLNCQLVIHDLGLTMLIEGKESPVFNMVAAVLSQVAEMERNNIKERQAEGIAIAKAKGVYQSRATRGKVDRDKQLAKHSDIVELLSDGNKSIRRIASLTKKGVSTVQRVKKLLDE